MNKEQAVRNLEDEMRGQLIRIIKDSPNYTSSMKRYLLSKVLLVIEEVPTPEDYDILQEEELLDKDNPFKCN